MTQFQMLCTGDLLSKIYERCVIYYFSGWRCDVHTLRALPVPGYSIFFMEHMHTMCFSFVVVLVLSLFADSWDLYSHII